MLNFIKTPHGFRMPQQHSIGNAHNPFVYITTSTKSSRPNFTYELDVFVNNEKLVTLAKNPDLSTGNSRFGIFDISEIISTELRYNPHLIGEVTDFDIMKYDIEISNLINVTLRESYSTDNKWTNRSNWAGGTRLFVEGTDLLAGDRILVNNKDVYNVVSRNSSNIFTNAPINTLPALGTFKEGQRFEDNYFYVQDGVGYVAFVTLTQPRIAAGDRIFIKQSGVPTNLAYDGEFRCQGVEQVNLGSFPNPNWIVKTNIIWGENTPAEGGAYFNLSDYKPVANRSTMGTRSYANNSVMSYEKFLDYKDTDYQFDGPTKRFLTNSPLVQKIKSDVPLSLGFFDLLPETAPWSHFNLEWSVKPDPRAGNVFPISLGSPAVDYAAITIDATTDFMLNDIITLTVGGINYTGKVLFINQGFPTINDTSILTTVNLGLNTTGTLNLSKRSYFSPRDFTNTYLYFTTKMIELGIPTQETLDNFPVQGITGFQISAVERFPNTDTSFPGLWDLVQRSEIREYIIDDICKEWNTHYIAWINPYGVWDYFEFTGRPQENNEIDKQIAQRSLLTFKSNDFTYLVGDRGNVTYNIEGERFVDTSTGIINRGITTWLKEVYTSPAAYVISADLKIPINILNTNIVLPDNQRGLVNMPLSFSYANKIWTQNN